MTRKQVEALCYSPEHARSQHDAAGMTASELRRCRRRQPDGRRDGATGEPPLKRSTAPVLPGFLM